METDDPSLVAIAGNIVAQLAKRGDIPVDGLCEAYRKVFAQVCSCYEQEAALMRKLEEMFDEDFDEDDEIDT